MKFISEQGLEFEYLEKYNLVKKSESPFKELLSKKEVPNFKLQFEEELSYNDVFQLRVNIKQVGSVLFFFKKEGFNKEEAINEIIPLKEMKVKDEETAKEKVIALIKVMEKYSPLFLVYLSNGKYGLTDEEFKPLTNDLLSFYLIRSEETVADNDGKFIFENPFKLLKEDKFHFIFAFIATLLIGFTLSLAIFDMYLGKLIYIFFLVCTLAGMVLNAFIYYDTIKQYGGIKNMYAILTVLFSFIGLGGSFGGYYLFKSLTKDVPKTSPSILIIVGAMFGAAVVSAFGSLIIKLIKDKRKARKK